MSRKTWLRAVSQGSVLLALTSCNQAWLADLTADFSPPPYGILGATSIQQTNAALNPGVVSSFPGSAGSDSVVSAATGTSPTSPSMTVPVDNGTGSVTGSVPSLNNTGVTNYLGLNGVTGMGPSTVTSPFGF
jgi:hypothetical protein